MFFRDPTARTGATHVTVAARYCVIASSHAEMLLLDSPVPSHKFLLSNFLKCRITVHVRHGSSTYGLSRNELIKNWPFSDPLPPLISTSSFLKPTYPAPPHLIIWMKYFCHIFVIFAQMILHCNILRIEIKDQN